MERYIGLDAHAASCTLAVISHTGRRLKDFPVETNGEALVEAIRRIPGHKHLVFEEGLQSAWLYETLRPHVDEVIVAGVTESRGQKSDKRDAYGLAERLRTGSLDKQIFKAPREFTLLREPSRAHITATRDLVRVQSRLKSLYRSRGVQTLGASVYSPAQRDAWEKRLPTSARRRAMQLNEQLDFFREQKKRIEADLLRESRKHKIVRILETAPGIGPIRAARLVPIVVTPHRFRTKRQFWSYCGLGIVTRSSSDWVQTADGGWIRARVPQTRGLSRQYNRVLKDIFKGAATLVITQRNKSPLYPRYERMLAGGTKPSLAKLTLARIIAATVLRMWKDEEEYRPERSRHVMESDRSAEATAR
jgi:transposase